MLTTGLLTFCSVIEYTVDAAPAFVSRNGRVVLWPRLSVAATAEGLIVIQGFNQRTEKSLVVVVCPTRLMPVIWVD